MTANRRQLFEKTNQGMQTYNSAQGKRVFRVLTVGIDKIFVRTIVIIKLFNVHHVTFHHKKGFSSFTTWLNLAQ